MKEWLMQVRRDIEDFPRDLRPVMTMGTFDGIHLGHRTIFDELLRTAKETDVPSVLLTFHPHPREVIFREGEPIYLLTTIEERIRILQDFGIDYCVVLPFTRNLSMLDSEEYFASIVVGKISPSHIVVGSDHAFGRGRSGHIQELQRLAGVHEIGVTVVPNVELEGQKISSTIIRKALMAGDVDTAHVLLGRPYLIHGIVERGQGLGEALGFPTANLHIDSTKKLLPKIGVYLVRVLWNDTLLFGLMNIGRRPTISVQGDVTVEVHILDFNENLYGLVLEVEVLQRIRDEIRFPSRDALVEQIARDKELALDLIQVHEKTY